MRSMRCAYRHVTSLILLLLAGCVILKLTVTYSSLEQMSQGAELDTTSLDLAVSTSLVNIDNTTINDVIWAELQHDRHGLIRQECVNKSESQCTSGSLGPVFPSQPQYLSAILVDVRHSVIYCAIPKVASSSLKLAIAHSTGLVAPSNKFDPHNTTALKKVELYTLGQFLSPKDHSLLPTPPSMGWHRFRKFIVVRDPFERLVSGYVDKFTQLNNYTFYFHRKYGRHIARTQRKTSSRSLPANGSFVTFPEFVNFITDEQIGCEKRINPHWASYNDLCRPCQFNYDHVIRFENFDREMSHVWRTLYGASHFGIPRKNPSHVGHTSNLLEQYRQQLTDTQRQKLNKLYADDLLMFGYKPV